ncbi:MAG: nitrilase-related carbon-nitrogen hydrolase [Pararhizobium sp.]
MGFWTPTVARFWRQEIRNLDVTVIAGAAILHSAGYDNVLIGVGPRDASVVYSERMPVPVSMWQPWVFGQHGGARAHFFANPSVEVADRKVAPLICYEQLLIWPVLLRCCPHRI